MGLTSPDLAIDGMTSSRSSTCSFDKLIFDIVKNEVPVVFFASAEQLNAVIPGSDVAKLRRINEVRPRMQGAQALNSQ
jgi:hypothetical protein